MSGPVREQCFILLGHSPSYPLTWCFHDGVDVIEAGVCQDASGLTEINDRLHQAANLCAILPGEQVAQREMPNPPNTSSKFRAAAALLLEDELGEDVDDLHIAVSADADTPSGNIHAVKRAIVDEWMQVFEALSLAPDAITVDYALLMPEPGELVLADDNARIVAGFARAGFASERELAKALSGALVKSGAIERISVFSRNGGKLELADMGVVIARQDADEIEMLRRYVRALMSIEIPNFRQGAYRKKTDWRAQLGPWKAVGQMVAACVGAFLVVTIASAWREGRVAQRYDTRAQAVHDFAYPNAPNQDPVRHARRVLANQNEGASFLALSSDFAYALEQVPAIQIDRVRYNASRGEFSANLQLGDINDLVALREALSARGVQTEQVGDIRGSNGVFLGQVRVRL